MASEANSARHIRTAIFDLAMSFVSYIVGEDYLQVCVWHRYLSHRTSIKQLHAMRREINDTRLLHPMPTCSRGSLNHQTFQTPFSFFMKTVGSEEEKWLEFLSNTLIRATATHVVDHQAHREVSLFALKLANFILSNSYANVSLKTKILNVVFSSSLEWLTD